MATTYSTQIEEVTRQPVTPHMQHLTIHHDGPTAEKKKEKKKLANSPSGLHNHIGTRSALTHHIL